MSKGKDKWVTLLANDTMKIVRPCCKAVGFLVRPNHEVKIPHKDGCPYGTVGY